MIKGTYRKGAEYEREIVNEFRSKGCIAARTAGSKSKIDIFVINPHSLEVTFIQAKCGSSFTDSKLKKIQKAHEWIKNIKKVNFEVWNKV